MGVRKSPQSGPIGFVSPSASVSDCCHHHNLIMLAHSRWRWRVTAVGSAFVLAVGLSRIYLGVHYPSDILVFCRLAVAGYGYACV